MRCTLLIWLLLFSLSPAWAQDEPATEVELELDALLSGEIELDLLADEELSIDLGEAEVLGTRTLVNLLDDARAVTLIPAESFGTAPSLAAVLERVPGMDVRSQGGLGQLSSVQLRGARSNQVLLLLDGVPLMQGPADLSAVPLPAIDRVEVLRGPHAARFGSAALGGVVNIVTLKAPAQTEIVVETGGCGNCPPEEPWDYTLELGAGSHGALTGSLSASQAGLAYGLSHLQAQNDFSFERTGGGIGTRRNNHVQQYDAWAGWDCGAWQHRAGFGQSQRGVPGSAEFPTLLAELERSSLWWQFAIAGQHFGLGLQELHFTDPEPYLNRGAINSRDTQYHAEYAWGSLADQRGSAGYRLRLTGVESNVYGQETRAGLDAHWHFERTDCDWRYQLDLGALASSDAGLDPVARLSASTPLSTDSQAYAAVGLAVRHPAFDELYYLDTGGVRGNPELNPERVLSYELGIEATTDSARYELALFSSHYEDSIIWAPVSAYLVESRNTGRARVAGLEALADVQLAEKLWWHTAYTWLPIAEFSSGVPLTGRTEHHANSRLEWLSENVQYAATLDYTGEIPADLFGNLIIEPRTIVGAELSMPFGQGQLGLNISNILDESTRDSWNYPLPGREVFITFRSEL